MSNDDNTDFCQSAIKQGTQKFHRAHRNHSCRASCERHMQHAGRREGQRGQSGRGTRRATKSLPGTATIQVCGDRRAIPSQIRAVGYSQVLVEPFCQPNNDTANGTRQTSFVLIGNSASQFAPRWRAKTIVIDMRIDKFAQKVFRSLSCIGKHET